MDLPLRWHSLIWCWCFPAEVSDNCPLAHLDSCYLKIIENGRHVILKALNKPPKIQTEHSVAFPYQRRRFVCLKSQTHPQGHPRSPEVARVIFLYLSCVLYLSSRSLEWPGCVRALWMSHVGGTIRGPQSYTNVRNLRALLCLGLWYHS